MDKLTQARQIISSVDKEIAALFEKRMDAAKMVAAYKKEHGLPILVPARESEKLLDVAEKAGPEMADYAKDLYTTLFRLSREYQVAHNKEVIE
jgi:chorismate mutase/prephenate dehydratase